MNLVVLIRGQQEMLPDCQKVRKESNACRKIRPFGCSHQLNSRQPRENLEREQEVVDTILDLLQPLTEG